MKRVLFVTQSYPSKFSANVLCDDMIIRHLLATRDVEVHCLCMKYHGENTEDVVNGVYVHRFAVGPYFEWRFETLDKPGNMSYRLTRALDKVFLRLGQALTIPFYPCYHPIRFLQYLHHAAALQKRFQFDVVACEHYGTECLLTGMYLKKRWPNVRYIQLFWDALSAGAAPGYLPRSFVDSRRKRLEERVFAVADISTALQSHMRLLRDRVYAKDAHARKKLVFLGIPNISDVNDACVRVSCPLDFDSETCNLVYSGLVDGRNIGYIARVVAHMDRDAILWIITATNKSVIAEQCSGVNQVYRIVPYMNHDCLLSVLLSADALINLGNSDSNAIPSKVSQYISCCKPIISTFSCDDDASAAYLKNYPSVLLLDERKANYRDAAQSVEHFLDDSQSVRIDFKEVEQNYSDGTPEAYCRLFDCSPKTESFHG